MAHSSFKLDDFFPSFFDKETHCIRWIESEGSQLKDPYYEDSIRRFRSSLKKELDLDKEHLLAYADSINAESDPYLFIFHVSRCGSTLLSQMLAQSANNLVLSEPPFLDEIFSAAISLEEKRTLITSILKVLALKNKSLFIKLDSWAILYYDELRTIFPSVPFLFLIRDPLEVMRSHQKIRGSQMVAGLLQPDRFQIKDVPAYDLDLYAEKVLEIIFQEMALKRTDPLVYLLDYKALPEGFFDLLEKLEIGITEEEKRLMLHRINSHSKNETVDFNREDQANKDTPQFRSDKLKKLYTSLNKNTIE